MDLTEEPVNLSGLETGYASDYKSFDDLMNAFRLQVNYFIDIKIRGNNVIEKTFSNWLPVPFLSLLVEDCIANGRDYNCGGARYNTSYIQGVGLGSITDMLTSIRYNIYDKKNFNWDELLKALDADFKGFEQIQYDLIYNTPKFGNDDDYADQQAVDVFEIYYDAVNGRPTPRGGVHRINMLPTTCHVYFGSVMGASPDGRNACKPLSEGISPSQGADKNGPTSVINSVSKIDHLRTGGTLLNQKFSPQFFEDENSYDCLTALIRSYFCMDGHHIQFNVVNAETLRDAQKNPELYRDLIVRVAGYSDYFNDLGEDLQNEIINRTEHETLCRCTKCGTNVGAQNFVPLRFDNVSPGTYFFVLSFVSLKTDVAVATIPAISERLAGTIIVLFVLARFPNAVRYCSAILRLTAFKTIFLRYSFCILPSIR